MTHFVEELQSEAEAAILKMRDAAEAARTLQARAELMRHMRTTASKVMNRPREDAVVSVVKEWMAAWQLGQDAYGDIAEELRRFTTAFCAYADDPSDAADHDIRAAAAVLEAALERQGTTLADQMAWRSECAHAWWALVRPVPPDLPGRRSRPGVPRIDEDRPFWESGCAPHCRADADPVSEA